MFENCVVDCIYLIIRSIHARISVFFVMILSILYAASGQT